MLLFIMIIFIAVGAFLIAKSYFGDGFWGEDFVWVCGLAMTIMGVVGSLASATVIATSYFGLDGYVESMHIRRDMLVYQYENNVYENDNDLGKRELYEDIQAWNEKLARGKANQEDFWIGIYIPNVYDQFEFIELNTPSNG